VTGSALLMLGGGDQPAIVAVIERAGGELDGMGAFW
jgi:hypothetical protein